MAVELRVPSAGESITEVQIADWIKREGDRVERDETVVEIETDKASMEIPAPTSGVIKSVLRKAGETVGVGEVIALIDESTDGAKSASATAKPRPAQEEPPAARSDTGKKNGGRPAATKDRPAEPARPAKDGEPRILPAARRALAEHGLRPEEVEATGPGGRLLKEDVLRHVAEHPRENEAAPPASPVPDEVRESRPAAQAPPPAAPAGPRHEEAVPMTMLRRRIAERLVESQHTAALLTTFNEVDMSAVMELRERWGEPFNRKYGIKLGFMSFFVKAAIDALKLIPQVNAEVRTLPAPDGHEVPHIVYKNFFDIGVAVSTDRGLVVPVIRNADRLSFAEVELAIADLARRARDKKLSLDELQGGTFTISNGGVFGSLMSTPIINPPQSGILGLHAIQDRPVARSGQVVIRPMMYIALTYDHRIVDGRESVTFLKRIKECIEDPARILVEV